jgi:dTDP-4-amino-4,6-dideoxygalactose transaminase
MFDVNQGAESIEVTVPAPVRRTDPSPEAEQHERIYLSVPHMSGAELPLVQDAFRSNWLSSVGPHLTGFENEVQELLGHGVETLAVTSGTAALHLILRAIGVGPGDRVAVATLTFAGSAYPISYLGATPVFLDCDADSATLTPATVTEYLEEAARRGELPKALIVVHLYGQHADVGPIRDACDRHGVVLVEDSAESLGATYRGRQTGTVADYSILSFNGNKIITSTGGGMVITRDAAALERMRKWANQSREPAVEYLHQELGYNYRMSNVLAAIGRGQLRVLGERVAARRAVAARYAAGLARFRGVELLPEMPWGTHTRWLTVIRIDPARYDVTPRDVVAALDKLDIETRPVWRPMHTQPLFQDAPYFGGREAERLYETGLCLPSSSSMTPSEQDVVLDALRAVLRARAR